MILRFIISAALTILSAHAWAGLEVSFDDVTEFTDFQLHRAPEHRTQIVFERDLHRFWEGRIDRLVPEDHTLELHFTDIDMAGRIKPLRNPWNPSMRYMEDRFPPRLKFTYTLRSPDGAAIASGEEDVHDPNFSLRIGSSMLRNQYAFAYEFDLLKTWAERALKPFAKEMAER